MSFYVADQFRENPISLTPGGKDVQIFYMGQQSRIYSRVKSPFKFWQKAKEENPNVKGYKVLGNSKD
jgi:hypothetical protein